MRAEIEGNLGTQFQLTSSSNRIPKPGGVEIRLDGFNTRMDLTAEFAV
jgi:hypothetical protein